MVSTLLPTPDTITSTPDSSQEADNICITFIVIIILYLLSCVQSLNDKFKLVLLAGITLSGFGQSCSPEGLPT